MVLRFCLLMGMLFGAFAFDELTASSCEIKDRKIKFAGLDWDSNGFVVEVASLILEKGFGCQTDKIPGSTIPLLTGMIKGDIDIMMEVWLDNIKEAWDKGVKAGDIADIGTTFKGATQGFYVPHYVIYGDAKRGIKAMAPDLKSVADLPKYKDLFQDKEEPSKGRIYNCILGWGCEVVNSNKIKAYQLDQFYTNYRPGTSSALDAVIVSAYTRGKPVVAYYWEPTWIMGKYQLVKLEEPAFDPSHWQQLSIPNVANPKGMAYPLVDVKTGVNAEFQKRAPQIVAFLTKFELSKEMINQALAHMQDHGVDHRQAALAFLSNHPQVWNQWLPTTLSEQVHQSLTKDITL